MFNNYNDNNFSYYSTVWMTSYESIVVKWSEMIFTLLTHKKKTRSKTA